MVYYTGIEYSTMIQTIYHSVFQAQLSLVKSSLVKLRMVILSSNLMHSIMYIVGLGQISHCTQ